MRKKVIVIGGGIGGLSVAARLLAYGFEVEVFEKNPSLGGKVNFLKHDDFKFDLTASLLMFANDYIDIFNFCEKNYNNYFSLIPINPLYRVFYNTGNTYNFFVDTPRLSSTLEKICNTSIKDRYGFYNFLTSNYEKYLLAESSVLNQSLTKSSNIFKSFLNNKGKKLISPASCFDDAKEYMDNEYLINYLMFQAMYIGVSPFKSPNIYNIISSVTQLHGLYHIQGGMYSYVKSLERLIIDQGGVIHPLQHVNKIIFNKKTAIGIEINGNEIYSDIVVCSSDYSYTLNNLIKDDHIKSKIKPIEDFEYSCSTFILYLALDKKYPSLNIHNIYINEDFEKNVENIFNDEIPESPSLYMYCPSCIDDSMCPTDCEILTITVRVPNLIHTTIVWNSETITMLNNKILSTLSSIDGLEDIQKHIIFKKHLTPVDLQNKFNTYGGCAFGLSHTLNQSAFLRPQCEIPKIKNLFFTGASIHPGAGVSMVLKSSKICADKIKELYSK